MRKINLFFVLCVFTFSVSCAQSKKTYKDIFAMDEKIKTATFGGGCFWCTDAIFRQIKGVDSVLSGYAGGETPNPTYKMVSTGKSGYIEVVRLYYDPKLISYSNLVEIFFGTHDPTSVDRQGHDVGVQYRSVIFYHDEEQEKQAEEVKKQMQTQFKKPIVTQILPIKNFYPAEEYHQDFYNQNTMYPYCKVVIKPKIDKLLQEFHPFINWKY